MPAWSVDQATRNDLPAVRRLLLEIFETSEDLRVFRPEVLAWKAFDPHPLWEGSRSYIARRGEEIVAHGIVIPLRLGTAGGSLRSHCIIDWAARKDAVGAGGMIYNHLRGRTDVQIGIGGSDQAQRVLPRMGFLQHQMVRLYARVLRPAAHLARVRGFGPGAWLRFVRDFKELARGRGTGAADLSAESCANFEAGAHLRLPDPGVLGCGVYEQTAESLNYMLRCPMRTEGYLFRHRGEPSGYCVLCRVGHQCRVASAWVPSGKAEDWTRAFVRMAELAAADASCTEILASASIPAIEGALAQAGFRVTNSYPLFVHRSQAAALGGVGVQVTLGENDGYYL